MKPLFINVVLVGLGGSLGALARYGVNEGLRGRTTFPYGTLIVNLTGCFAIGVMAGLLSGPRVSPALRAFVIIGFLGGFTTFSTFGYETFTMIQEAQYIRAVANLFGHVVLGILLVGLGYALIR